MLPVGRVTSYYCLLQESSFMVRSFGQCPASRTGNKRRFRFTSRARISGMVHFLQYFLFIRRAILQQYYAFVVHSRHATYCAFVPDCMQVVQIRPGGTLGTQLLPLSVDLHKTVASLAGRLCATMVAGVPDVVKLPVQLLPAC